MTTTPAIRVTQYRIGPGEFTGITYDLKLNRALAPDYFVLIHGTVQDTGGAVGPDLTSVIHYADPWGTGGLFVSAGDDVIGLARKTGGIDWQGVIQVVECERDQDGNGFRLLTALRLNVSGSTGTGVVSQRWPLPTFPTDGRGVLLGGPRAGGASSRFVSAGPIEQPSAQARVYYDAGDVVIERYEATGAGVQVVDYSFTVYVLQWGDQWSVQSVNVTGGASGQGNSPAHWNTAPIDPVSRVRSWAFVTSWTQNDAPGESAAGIMVELGDGATQLATEALAAVNYRSPPGGSSSQVVILSHPSLVVDWQASNDQAGVLWTADWTVPAPLVLEDHAPAPQVDGRDVSITTGHRVALTWQSALNTALGPLGLADYPASFWHGHHVADTVLNARRLWGKYGVWASRRQSIDLGAVGVVADLVDAGSLQPESSDTPESTTGLVYVPDHPDQAVADLLLVLRQPRICALTRAMADGAQVMEDQLFALLVDRDLQTATGAQLDQWGELVGEQRGGLGDDDYRRFIQARIKANRSGGSTDELIAIWQLVTGPSVAVRESALYPAGLQLWTVREAAMTDDVARRVQRIMLDTARPSGISIDLVEAISGYLGFIGNPDAFPLDIGTLARSLNP